MEQKRLLRVVVASPGDVQAERDVLPVIMEELNRGIAEDRSLRLEVFRWETDAYPGFHPDGPQGLIDPILSIQDCDLLIGIFGGRFGTPTKDAQSGTEHEFRLAYESWKQKGSPQIMLYFRQVSHEPGTDEERKQLRQVRLFRDSLPPEGLWWPYGDPLQFENLARKHLTNFIRRVFPLPSQGADSGRSRDNLLVAYHAHLLEKVGKVYIVGENHARELERVFVKLNIVEEHQRPLTHAAFLGMMDAEMRLRRDLFASDDEEVGSSPKGKAADKLNRMVKPDELLHRHNQAIITGAPGCGKTTLLRYLALKTLKGGKYLPVFLELKTVSEEAFKQAQGNLASLLFDKVIASVLHLQVGERERFDEFFRERLAAGDVAIFLDGLDEVRGTGFFPALCNSVGEFVRSAYRHNTLILSTRPNAMRTRFEGLKEMEIAPLDHRQIEEFLTHYYGDSSAMYELLKSLRQHQSLYELARIPFLLSVISQLHGSQNKIIEHRLELYRQIVLHLIVVLDGEKSLPLSHFYIPDPDGALKLDFLKHLACERLLAGYVNGDMVEQETTRLVFTGEVLVEEAKEFLAREGRTEINPRWLAADLKSTPMLREVGTDVYAFSHLTLQEYLAAAALSRRANCEKIFCQAFFNPTLAEMEVLPMTLGLVSDAESFYTAIEQLPDSLTFTGFRLRARGLAYVSNLSEQLLTRLTKHLIFEHVYGRLPGATPYRKAVFRSFSAAGSRFLEFVVDQVATHLKTNNAFLLWKVAIALEEIGSQRAGDAALKAWEQIDNPVLRDRLLTTVGKLGGEQAITVLIELLESEETLIHRSRIVRDLGRIGGEQAVGPLTKELKFWDNQVRTSAIEALGQIGGERATEALIDALQGERPPIIIGSELYERSRIAETLRQIGGERAVDSLLSALKHKNAAVRAGAAKALGHVGAEQVIYALLDAFKDEDHLVASAAAESLGQIGDERAVAPLLDALKHEDSFVRFNAAEALGGRGGEQVVKVAAEELKSKYEFIREKAVKLLGRVGGGCAVEVLLEALEDEHRSVRQAAARTLGEMGEKRAAMPLTQLLQDEDKFVRWKAAEALMKVGDERIVEPLIAALHDPDEGVRAHAVEALGRIGGKSAVEALVGVLKRRDGSLHWTTARALKQIGGERAVVPLLEMMKEGDEDRYLCAYEALGSCDYVVLGTALLKALSHPAAYIRWKAAQYIGYYTHERQALDELSRLEASDPVEGVKKVAGGAREQFTRKLRYFS
ncbi:MAG: HEAT repeat domain-containing protein [Acidobacteria bacterium]|nr:HEAT repeat domain-containing protein [Acidobacteriota bacterium]